MENIISKYKLTVLFQLYSIDIFISMAVDLKQTKKKDVRPQNIFKEILRCNEMRRLPFSWLSEKLLIFACEQLNIQI